MSSKNIIRIFLNTLLGVLLITVWLHFVDIGKIFKTISQVEPVKIVPILFFMALSPVIRAVRLKVFLAPIKKIALKDLIFLNGVAMLLNFLIPIRAGEIAKGIYLNSEYKLNLGKSLLWIFLDRFVDFLVVLTLATLLFFVVPSNLPGYFVEVLIIIFAVAAVMTYLMVYNANFSRKIFNFLRFLLIINSLKIYFERVSEFFIDSFSILRRHPGELAWLFFITVLAYLADAFIWFFVFVSLGNPQGLITMYLAQLLTALAYLIPAAPGYVGSAEASGSLVFSGVLGLNLDLASSAVVFLHMITLSFVIIYGVISLYSLKINLGVILRKALKKEAEV